MPRSAVHRGMLALLARENLARSHGCHAKMQKMLSLASQASTRAPERLLKTATIRFIESP